MIAAIIYISGFVAVFGKQSIEHAHDVWLGQRWIAAATWPLAWVMLAYDSSVALFHLVRGGRDDSR